MQRDKYFSCLTGIAVQSRRGKMSGTVQVTKHKTMIITRVNFIKGQIMRLINIDEYFIKIKNKVSIYSLFMRILFIFFMRAANCLCGSTSFFMAHYLLNKITSTYTYLNLIIVPTSIQNKGVSEQGSNWNLYNS